jgi:hypothetical protein
MIFEEKTKLILLILLTLILVNIGCAKPPPEIIVYQPPRCPHYIWNERALQQLLDLQIITELSGTNGLSLLYITETGEVLNTNFSLILENIGEYNRHCNAIDAYLDQI